VPVFYRGRRALITHEVFETTQVCRRQFVIGELANVHIVRHDPGSDSGNRVLGMSALVAALVVVPVVGPASEMLAGLSVVVLLAGAVASLRRRSPVRWQLVATWGEQPIVLFESTDETEFQQVCRGLRRALERQSERR
jgi:hypothetical protein